MEADRGTNSKLVLSDYGEVNMTGMRIASHSLPMYHGMGISQVLWAVSFSHLIRASLTHTLLNSNRAR